MTLVTTVPTTADTVTTTTVLTVTTTTAHTVTTTTAAMATTTTADMATTTTDMATTTTDMAPTTTTADMDPTTTMAAADTELVRLPAAQTLVPTMRLSHALICAAGLLAGCPDESSPVDPPEVPVLDDPRGLTTTGEPCTLLTSTVGIHASLDTLDLDHGAVIFWVFKQDTVVLNNGDFPASGELVFRGYNIHRIGFPQEYQLCMPPGRYTVRAVQDTNHNGQVCEFGENWGTINVVHPISDPSEGYLMLDSILTEEDGCPQESTGLPSGG